MKGIFIGKKDAMGFKTGREYDIHSEIKMVRRGGFVFGDNLLCICIYDNNSNAWCPYQSLEAVCKNWKFNDP